MVQFHWQEVEDLIESCSKIARQLAEEVGWCEREGDVRWCHEVPGITLGFHLDFMGFHGISWDFMGFHGVQWGLWGLMGFHKGFHKGFLTGDWRIYLYLYIYIYDWKFMEILLDDDFYDGYPVTLSSVPWLEIHQKPAVLFDDFPSGLNLHGWIGSMACACLWIPHDS